MCLWKFLSISILALVTVVMDILFGQYLTFLDSSLQSNGRPSLKTIMQQWNKVTQKNHGAGDVAKPKPLNLTPVSGADLLGPVEAPLPTPDKNSTVPGLVIPQQEKAKKPVIEIVAPPSILTSGLKVAAPPVNLKAGLLKAPELPPNLLPAPPGMPQNALPAPAQQLMIEGAAAQPGQQLAIEGPQPPAQPGQQLAIEGPPAPTEGPAPVLGNELVPVTPTMPVSFPGSQVAFEGQLLGMAPQPMPAATSFPPLGFQSGSQLPPLGQPGPMMGFEALGMTPFVAKPSQPVVADFSDLDGFKAMKSAAAPTSGPGSQPLGDFFSSSTGLPKSASGSALMDLSSAPPTSTIAPSSAAPTRAGTPPPANGNNELISLT